MSTAAVAVASAVGIEISRPSSAAAAVTWGYPFTARSGRSRGFTGQWPAGHAGIDYTPGIGTPIHAVADGTIILSGISGSNGAFGQSIWIQHADGYRTIYAHMLQGSRVTTGPISRGQYIGKVGNTGQSYGAHLHIELHRNGVALDPDPFINAAPLAGVGAPQPPRPTLEDDIATQIWLYTPTNHLLLVDHMNMTIRDLGGQNSLERSAFDGLAYRTVGEPAWTQNFSNFKYITAPA